VAGDALTFVADRGDHGRRLDLVLARHLASLPRVSRTRLQALIEGGAVEVGGHPWTRVAQRVQAGFLVRVLLPATLLRREGPEPEPIPLDILHEDDALLVINKPPGLIVHPSYAHRAGTLINALVHLARSWPEGRPSLVHRLDKHTSGALVVAKSREAHAACARALAAADSRKEYLALCYGRMRTPALRIREPLGRDPADRRRVIVRPDGAAALTEATRLGVSRGAARGLTLVACRLLTGRMHQIRAHLQSRGLPIVGDPTYGEPFRSAVADAPLDARLRAFGRQALHAWRVTLRHPFTGRTLAIEAPVPADLASLLARCGLGIPLSGTELTVR
jgi:23S rRNA pseudouridine1911/1915/1917 synthase